MGYIGTDPLEYAKGSYEKLMRQDQTEEYPWLVNAPIYGKQAKEEDRSIGKTSFDIGVELTGKTYMT